jgi:hypothetical protein
MHILNYHRILLTLCAVLFSAQLLAADAQKIKPFIFAKTESGEMKAIIAKTKDSLSKNGFEVVGEYSPYPSATIIIVTNDALRNNAAQTEFGAYGAIQRVTLTESKDGIQVSYTNPVYMAQAYRLKSDLSDIKAKLQTALGGSKEYGPDKGLSAEDLREYHYKWLMPYFSDRIELAEYKDQATALAKVNEFLAKNKSGAKKIYQVDLPNKEESVIGVSLAGSGKYECSGDQYIMSRIDFKELKSTGHLPYEIVVSKGKVYTLFAEFRIAINFPDLSMVGDNSFASIMCAPTAIKNALTKAVGGKIEE